MKRTYKLRLRNRRPDRDAADALESMRYQLTPEGQALMRSIERYEGISENTLSRARSSTNARSMTAHPPEA